MDIIKSLHGERKDIPMEQSKPIRVIIFSYKSKNLEKVVQSVIDGASSELCVDVIDKNPIDRTEIFNKYSLGSYRHVNWSVIDNPTIYKDELLHDNQFDYFLIISDDTILSPGWDDMLINFLKDKDNVVISGNHMVNLYHNNKFFLGKMLTDTNDFVLTNFIDRNLIFIKSKDIDRFKYPTNVKYFGEEELLSLRMFVSGIDIYAAPTKVYQDLNVKSLENTFVQFSIYHNYNNFIDVIKNSPEGNNDLRTVKDFIKYHRIEISNINPLPFPKNDVLYSTKIDLHFDKGERFFNGKATV